MLARFLIFTLPTASSFVAASVIRSRSNGLCWSGEIHSPCDWFSSGCTPDGILVGCQNNSSMIFSSMCDCSGSGGTCTYDSDCNAYCVCTQ
ncbi:hypothetical protein F5B20DRAFT_547881 [Whalleya microplaca]|nr:hypothetical protein F5B20DRAFT_547881 [Whalleya microplaca]